MPEQEGSGLNNPGRVKRPIRELERRVMRSPVPEEAVKPVLLLWNHEESYRDQSPRVLDEIETLLNLQEMPWPNQSERSLILGMKVDIVLYRLLHQHGYRYFTYSVRDHKPRLKASPKLGTVPKELPDWLDMPYLCLLPPQNWSIRYEGYAKPSIRAGDCL